MRYLGRFLEIQWVDAKSETSWVTFGSPEWEALLPAPVTTRGWCIKETPEALTLAGTRSQEPKGTWDFSEIITIPRAWKVGKIRVVEKERMELKHE